MPFKISSIRRKVTTKSLSTEKPRYVPLMASLPDIFDAKPFHRVEIGKFVAFGFRDIETLAARNGGPALLLYPLVLAVFDPQAPASEHGLVFIFAVELGNMFGTSCLGGFNIDGIHLNYGTCNPNINPDEFFRRAIDASRDNLLTHTA